MGQQIVQYLNQNAVLLAVQVPRCATATTQPVRAVEGFK